MTGCAWSSAVVLQCRAAAAQNRLQAFARLCRTRGRQTPPAYHPLTNPHPTQQILTRYSCRCRCVSARNCVSAQTHYFIFAVAVTHILYCAVTIALTLRKVGTGGGPLEGGRQFLRGGVRVLLKLPHVANLLTRCCTWACYHAAAAAAGAVGAGAAADAVAAGAAAAAAERLVRCVLLQVGLWRKWEEAALEEARKSGAGDVKVMYETMSR